MKSIKETLLKYYPNAEKELSKEKLRKVYAAMIDLSDAVATERVKNIDGLFKDINDKYKIMSTVERWEMLKKAIASRYLALRRQGIRTTKL